MISKRNAAIEKWQKENVRRVVVKFYKNTDAALLEFLDKQENMQGLIKRLLRDEMKKEGK